MIVLGIETSCDETAAAVVKDGRFVLSSVVNSQVELHRPYGGVVPEVASRSHVASLPDVIKTAVADSGVQWCDIDAVAVTYGPGLASSLLVGLTAAKALSIKLARPLIGINHLRAHIYSLFIGKNPPVPEEVCPFIALVVSGGHTCLVRVVTPSRYVLLGQTMDDAAGEAFDKGSNLLGLGYPGGPAIDRTAKSGRVDYVRFPRGRQRKETERVGGLDVELCFSFSGLKTALLYHLKNAPMSDGRDELANLAASYQEAIVDALVGRCSSSIGGEKYLAAVGGVSLNSRLRAKLTDYACEAGIGLLLSEPKYCADNAAMVAGLAGAGQGVSGSDAMNLDAEPNLEVA